MARRDLGYAPENAWSPPFQFEIDGTKYAVGVFTLVIDMSPMLVLSRFDPPINKWLSLSTSASIREGTDPMPFITDFLVWANKKLAERHPDIVDGEPLEKWEEVALIIANQLQLVGKELKLTS